MTTIIKTVENKDEYNGWTNYATWRVNLEIIDGIDWSAEIKEGNTHADIGSLKAYLQSYIDDAVFSDEGHSTALLSDYARAFLTEVNYHEIAQHIVDDYPAVLTTN